MRIEIEPGTRLYVDIDGAGLVPDTDGRWREKPALVLLHGGPGMDHRGWKPRISPLADIAQLVYFDFRGHGRSDRCPREQWTLDRWADDIVLLCAALGIERPIVFGQSFGGMVAQRYLARHPGHPSKAIVSSASPHFALERKLQMFERLGGPRARAVAETYWSAPTPEAFERYLEVCLPLYNPTAQPDRGPAAQGDFDSELLDHWNATELPQVSLLPGLAQVRCPVLVMGGELDPVTPIVDQRDIAAALPPEFVRFEAFAGAGHGIWRDRPDDAMALLRDFIQRR